MPCPNCRCPSCLGLAGSPEFSPPSPELMVTNRAPTNSEVAHSQDIIGSSERRISLMQSVVDDIEKRKAELLGLVRIHKAAISPLRSFPAELLAEIFSQFVAMAEAHRDYRHPPLLLMGVCSRWRRIAVDTPQLWTKIFSPHSMIDSWVTRSKGLPLHLQFNCHHPELGALIPHSHRWEHVDLCLDPNVISILAPVKTRLPSLKRLSLFLGDTSETGDFCAVAPQLTEVKLMGIRTTVTISLPWKQIRVCTVDTSLVACYVLQHASNLRRLHLDMFTLSAPPWLPLPIWPHSHHLGLDTLIVDWAIRWDPALGSFFSSITLPSLRTLRVHFNYPDPGDTLEDPTDSDDERAEFAFILAAFFKRSCTHLNALKLIGIPFSSGGLIGCLESSPSLVSLDIQFNRRWHAIDNDLLRIMNISHPSRVLPRLHSLALRGRISRFSMQALEDLVTSRRHINPERHEITLLENLTLEESRFDGYEPPRFHRFISEGLNITYAKDGSTQADGFASLEEQA